MDPRLQELCDRADILDCLQRYARGIDRLDRELLRSAYHDGAIDDHVGFVGPVDDFIDWAFAYHATQTRHQHYLMNHTADIAGDEAHAETYYMFVGTDRDPAKPLIVSGGRYIDRFERRDGRWAIAARVCLVEWQSDATSLLSPELVEFLDTVQTVARDTSDNSYDRPLVITRSAASP
ncbi:MAG: nuclear transport factor 2 family protein [Mycobacterium sp.]